MPTLFRFWNNETGRDRVSQNHKDKHCNDYKKGW